MEKELEDKELGDKMEKVLSLFIGFVGIIILIIGIIEQDLVGVLLSLFMIFIGVYSFFNWKEEARKR